MRNIFQVKWIFYIILLSALVVAITVLKSNLGRLYLPEVLWKKYLFLAVVGQLMFWYLSSFAWAASVKSFTGVSLGALRGFIQSNVVAVGKYLPGKVWGILNRSIDLKRQGLTNPQTLLVSYLDQVLLLHAGVLVGGVAYAYHEGWLWATLLLAVASIVLMPLFHTLLTRITANGLQPPVGGFAINKQLTVARYAALIFLYSASWIAAGWVFSCLYFWLYGFHLQLVPVLISANAFGILAGFLAFFAPGGIGVREAGSVAILNYYIPVEQALVLVLLYRVWTIGTDIIGGGVSFMLSREPLNKPTTH